MDKKNTMLLTVIAVATLLVAVVGATFAYYSVTSSQNNSTTTLNTTTQKVGTVTLTTTQADLYLHVTAEQMSKTNAGNSFYSTTTATDAATTVPNPQPTLATFELTGASQGDVYSCTYDYSLTTQSDSANYANLTAEDGSVILSTDTTSAVITGIPASTTLFATKGTGVTGSGTVVLTAGKGGTASAVVKGYAQWNNLNDNGAQNRIAELNMDTVLSLSNLSCDTVARNS